MKKTDIFSNENYYLHQHWHLLINACSASVRGDHCQLRGIVESDEHVIDKQAPKTTVGTAAQGCTISWRSP